MVKPEPQAREEIDRQLKESGWVIQDRDEINLSAAQGVAVREFKLKSGHGSADYLLFVDTQAVGVLEAKKVKRCIRDEDCPQGEKEQDGRVADARTAPLC